MRTRASRTCLAALALATGVGACARNPAPRRWLAPAREAQADPYGAWIVVRGEAIAADGRADARAKSVPVLASGELLAVGEDSVFVLSAEGRVEAVARTEARTATIAWYDGQSGLTARWAAIGALSTLSHGFGLILSGPIWILTGTIAAGADSRAPLVTVKYRTEWVEARAYARFPAGLPSGLPRVLPVKPRRPS
jgi:hypothetical protein